MRRAPHGSAVGYATCRMNALRGQHFSAVGDNRPILALSERAVPLTGGLEPSGERSRPRSADRVRVRPDLRDSLKIAGVSSFRGMALNRAEFRSVSGTSALIPRYMTGSRGTTGDSGAWRTVGCLAFRAWGSKRSYRTR
jgi:hypothetical protein